MHFLRFIGRAIHGYLNVTVPFNRTLTLLTGINGSGKTTVLNSISALVTPDLRALSDFEYKEISLQVEIDGKLFLISATNNGTMVQLSISGASDTFKFPRYIPDDSSSTYRPSSGTSDIDYYKTLLATHTSHPVIKTISSLPTPMFLGLSRRAEFDEETRRSRYAAARFAGRNRNIFSGPLTTSLFSALAIAQDRYRDSLIESGRIAEYLQKETIFSLLTFDTQTMSSAPGSIVYPSNKDRTELNKAQHSLEALSKIFNLSRTELRSRVNPFLEKLRQTIERIPSNIDSASLLSELPKNREVVEALIFWSVNQPSLQKLRDIARIVTEYNERRASIFRTIDNYLSTINRYLNDSGKSIAFDEDGYLWVRIKGNVEGRPINSLSSGEAQIFVILTHLSFNKLAQANNVFIIDEPELSLHVQWQEFFVESVISVNSSIQYIMATHSPSIILDRINDCVDMNRRKRRG